ncbi:MAG: hypothetical protein U0W40_13855 [Acidimicrobiia bacterium]
MVLLAGPKEAGKTTLVARLAQRGWRDRGQRPASSSTTAGSAWTACPIGTVVSVRGGTRERVPALAGPFPDVRSPAHLTVAELAALPPAAPTDDPAGRITLSPAQFAHALGAARSGGGTVAALVLLAVDPTVDGYAIARLDASAAALRLAAVEYGDRPEGLPRTVYEEWLGVAHPRPMSRDGGPRARHRVPVLTLTTGPTSSHDSACRPPWPTRSSVPEPAADVLQVLADLGLEARLVHTHRRLPPLGFQVEPTASTWPTAAS